MVMSIEYIHLGTYVYNISVQFLRTIKLKFVKSCFQLFYLFYHKYIFYFASSVILCLTLGIFLNLFKQNICRSGIKF